MKNSGAAIANSGISTLSEGFEGNNYYIEFSKVVFSISFFLSIMGFN
jgi:hypothetical protein